MSLRVKDLLFFKLLIRTLKQCSVTVNYKTELKLEIWNFIFDQTAILYQYSRALCIDTLTQYEYNILNNTKAIYLLMLITQIFKTEKTHGFRYISERDTDFDHTILRHNRNYVNIENIKYHVPTILSSIVSGVYQSLILS